MITASALGFVFALMIAPRKLQSLAAPVQAEAAAVSSVRSTFRIVANAGPKFEARGDGGTARDFLDELEDAVPV